MAKKLILLIIFLIAVVFRFWNLSSYPVSLSMDEVSIGYNAYSILKTGRDEWGQILPLAFKSVGDYKPPINIYLAVPSVLVFGLTEFGVRFPTALIGSVTPLIFVLLVNKLGLKGIGGYFAGLWLAISPWHVHFSRASFEAVTALFFLILGIYLLLKWIDEQKLQHILFSVMAFSLSVWSYHAERLVVPIVVTFLVIYFRKKINLKNKITKYQVIFGCSVLLIFALPFIYLTLFTPAISARAASTSILRDPSLAQTLHNGNYSNLVEKILDNDIYLIFRHWAGKYLAYFDLRFWFWKGLYFTPPGYPDVGLLYTADLLLFVPGIYALIKSENRILTHFSIFWFFIGPLSASVTMNEQHPLRALVWVPFFGIVMGLGLEFLFNSFKRIRKYLILGYGILLIANVIYFSDIYINHFPRFFAEYWQYGYKQVALTACANDDKYEQILITDTFGSLGPLNTGTPYLYVLFYCKVDPGHYQNDPRLGNIYFRRPDWKRDSKMQKTLLIGSPWDYLDVNIPKERFVSIIKYPSDLDAFILTETSFVLGIQDENIE